MTVNQLPTYAHIKKANKYHLQLYFETKKRGIDFCTSQKFTNSFLSNLLIKHIAFQVHTQTLKSNAKLFDFITCLINLYNDLQFTAKKILARQQNCTQNEIV